MSVLIKPGVSFGPVGTGLAPAGARLLQAVKAVAALVDFDITITSANDSTHAVGSAHYTGEAFDLRVNTLTARQKLTLLTLLRGNLYPRTPEQTRRFYVVLEDDGGPNQHIHCQRRAGTAYSVYDFLADL